MLEFESYSLKTSNEHVDVVQAVSPRLVAKKIGISQLKLATGQLVSC